jgi:hypothetical protein
MYILYGELEILPRFLTQRPSTRDLRLLQICAFLLFDSTKSQRLMVSYKLPVVEVSLFTEIPDDICSNKLMLYGHKTTTILFAKKN